MEMIFIILFLVGLNISFLYINYRNKYAKHPTFNEYKIFHPESVTGDKVKCFSCNGTNIQFRGLSNATDRRKIHYCVTCGKPLYKSCH